MRTTTPILSWCRTATALACLTAAPACEAPAELDEEVADSEGAPDDSTFRFSTPFHDFPTLMTSMNTDGAGHNGGCWDTGPGGTQVFQQYQCHAHDNQLWLFEPIGNDGAVRIKSVADPGLCVDVPSSNFAPSQNLQLHPCHLGQNQRWQVVVEDLHSASIRPNTAQHLCLSVEGAVQTGQAALELGTCIGGDFQRWRFHDWAGEDTSLDCDWAMRFHSVVVPNGQRASFPVPNLNTLCTKNWQPDSVDCPAWADWLVVDSPWGSDDFDVRCFNTQ